MRTALAILGLLCISTTHASAQPATPKGPPPSLIAIESGDADKGTITMFRLVVKQIPREVEETIIQNGVQVVVKKLVVVNEYVHEAMSSAAKDYRFFSSAGKEVPMADVWKRLKNGTSVVLSNDNNVPDAIYLRALHADTLVLIPQAGLKDKTAPVK